MKKIVIPTAVVSRGNYGRCFSGYNYCNALIELIFNGGSVWESKHNLRLN